MSKRTRPKDDHNIPVLTDIVTKGPRLLVLKHRLKNAFHAAGGVKGLARHAFNGVADKIKNRKTEMILTAGASFGIKLAVLSCTASFAATIPGIMLIGAVTGATSSIIRHNVTLFKAEKGAARDALRLSHRDMAKKILTGAIASSLFAGAGSGAASAYSWFKETCGGGPHGLDSFIATHHANPAAPAAADHASAIPAPQTPPPPDAAPAPKAVPAPATTPTPEAAPAPAPSATPDAPVPPIPAPHTATSPLDAIKEYAAQNKVSPKLKDALLRAESSSPHVRAQALDDIAVYAPKSMQVQAYDLLQKSASLGNLKAKADMITIEFYGNKALGIKANPEAAVDKMVALSKHSKFAARLVEQWVGPSPSAPVPPVAPIQPLEHFDIPADATRVTTVDITTPEVPAVPAPDCTVAVDPANVQNLILSCDVNAGDIGVNEGEVIYIKRPPMPLLAPRM